MRPTSATPRTGATGTHAWTATVFDDILCGVDGSEGSQTALHQAVRLLGARRMLRLVGLTGSGPTAERRRTAVELQLQRAHSDHHHHVHTSLAPGDPGRTLVAATRDCGATLTVVAAAPYAWPGGTETVDAALHEAPGSVLVARPPLREALFPGVIVAGKGPGDPAGAVAAELAHRFGAELRSVRLDVDAFVDASTSADLVVVGGPEAARIARAAYSSVLVVREHDVVPVG